jgi:CHAD domain-containing protein
MRERELKLQLAVDAPLPLPDLERAEARDLRAVYYDTADLRLARLGASLRHRNDEGWMVKLPGSVDGALMDRSEVRFDGGPGDLPPPGAIALVSSITRGAPVAPVAEICTRRRAVRLDVGELADDHVVARQPGGAPLAEFREIELELVPSADLADAEDVLARLRAGGARPADGVSKLVRALGPRAAVPADVDPPTLVDEPTLREVIQHALATSTRALVVRLPGTRLDDDPEDVHQARVGIRRIRSHLRTFRPVMEPRWSASLDGDLRRLGGGLGDVRDLDVLMATIAPMPLDGDGHLELLAALETEREQARERLLDTLDDPGCLQVLDRLVDAAADPHLAPQADDAARPVLASFVARPWRRLRTAVRRLDDPPTDAALHDVRIRAKRARYAAEAVHPVVGRPAHRLAARLADVQDALGELNDAAVITARLDALTPMLTSAGGFAAGRVSGILTERALEHRSAWQAAWRRVDRRALTAWLR